MIAEPFGWARVNFSTGGYSFEAQAEKPDGNGWVALYLGDDLAEQLAAEEPEPKSTLIKGDPVSNYHVFTHDTEYELAHKLPRDGMWNYYRDKIRIDGREFRVSRRRIREVVSFYETASARHLREPTKGVDHGQ